MQREMKESVQRVLWTVTSSTQYNYHIHESAGEGEKMRYQIHKHRRELGRMEEQNQNPPLFLPHPQTTAQRTHSPDARNSKGKCYQGDSQGSFPRNILSVALSPLAVDSRTVLPSGQDGYTVRATCGSVPPNATHCLNLEQ